MKKIQNKKGFTLIELLVVITIIGILATGATAVYTSQIQKARDTTRVTDITTLKGALEQVFQDSSEYPEGVDKKAASATCISTDASFSEDTFSVDCAAKMGFIAKLPSDPKAKQAGNGSALDYIYAVGPVNSVLRQAYEISSGFENEGNKTSKAANDNGNDKNRFEAGVLGANIATHTSGNDASNTTPADSVSAKISTKTSCQPLGSVGKSTSTANSMPIVIRGTCTTN